MATASGHHKNTQDRDDRRRPEQAISAHHFRFWGALGKSALFVCCGLASLLLALVCLGGAILATRSSLWEPVVWGAFALAGAISACACFCAATRLFTRMP